MADRDVIGVPKPVVVVGRGALVLGQRALYEGVLDTVVTGGAFVRAFGGYLVAAIN